MSQPDYTGDINDRRDDISLLTWMSSHIVTGLAKINGKTAPVVSMLDDTSESWLTIDLRAETCRTLATQLNRLADVLDTGYQLP
jgi:hypothetical protein